MQEKPALRYSAEHMQTYQDICDQSYGGQTVATHKHLKDHLFEPQSEYYRV